MADELDRIDTEPTIIPLSSGLKINVVRIRTRQFMRLLKVLTHGSGPAIMQSSLDFSAKPGEFASKLLTLILFSIPDAEAEAIDFIQSMCEPVGQIKGPGKRSKQDNELNAAKWDEFNRELFNPPLGDTISIIEAVVRQEAGEIQELGKRLMSLVGLVTRELGGEKEDKPEVEQPDSSAALPSSSTPSAPATDGATSTSSTSLSAV